MATRYFDGGYILGERPYEAFPVERTIEQSGGNNMNRSILSKPYQPENVKTAPNRFSTAVTQKLNKWYSERKAAILSGAYKYPFHTVDPMKVYLTPEDIQDLMEDTGLAKEQVKNWVSNKRNREGK